MILVYDTQSDQFSWKKRMSASRDPMPSDSDTIWEVSKNHFPQNHPGVLQLDKEEEFL